MAITEQDYLLLTDLNKARTWMLLRGDRHFHLVRVDASLTEKAYDRLTKRYPCSLKELQGMGLHVTPMNREACTHVVFEGTDQGARLTLYCSGNIRNFALGNTYTRERLEAFFDTQQHRWDTIPEPEGPDERTTRIIGWTMSGVSVVLSLMTLFLGRVPGRWAAGLSLLIFAAAVVLCVRWPGRFTISGLKKDFRTRRSAYRFEMELALGIPPLVMALDVMEHYTYPELLPLLLWGALLGLVIGVLLTWASREYRSIIGGAIGLTLWLMILSGGIIAQINQILDFGPTTSYDLTVDATDISGGRRTNYYCYVTMPNGEREQFSIPWSRYEDMNPGDPVAIIRHDGALGMEYLTIDWNE